MPVILRALQNVLAKGSNHVNKNAAKFNKMITEKCQVWTPITKKNFVLRLVFPSTYNPIIANILQKSIMDTSFPERLEVEAIHYVQVGSELNVYKYHNPVTLLATCTAQSKDRSETYT